MNLVESEIRKVIQMPCKYRSDYLKRNDTITNICSEKGNGFIQIMYGAISLSYPFETEPREKLIELDVVFDGLNIADWEPKNMLVMEHDDCVEGDDYWSFADDEGVVGDYLDFITDYIELVYEEKIIEHGWKVAA